MTKHTKHKKSSFGRPNKVLRRNRIKISKIWLIVLCVFSILSIVSFVFKNITGHGVFNSLINAMAKSQLCCLQWLSAILYALHGFAVTAITAEALLEMAKIIGIGSFSIGMVLNNLGKRESGFYYSELLTYLYPKYMSFLFLHIAGILFALWQAKIGFRESAVLALSVVVLDFIPQWEALNFLIFSTTNRRKLARKKWTKAIDHISASGEYTNFSSSNSQQFPNKVKEKDLTKFQGLLCHLADTLSQCSEDNYSKLVHCFSHALCKYSDFHDPTINTRDTELQSQYTKLLLPLKNVWGHLMSEKAMDIDAMDERRRLFISTAKEISRIQTKTDKHKGVIKGQGKIENIIRLVCLSYILWLCQMYTVKGAEKYDDVTMAMIALSNELAMIEYDEPFFAAGSKWRAYLESAYTVLVWEHVLLRNIGLDDRLFLLQPTELPDKADNIYWNAFVDVHFLADNKETAKQILPKVLKQIELQIAENRKSFYNNP